MNRFIHTSDLVAVRQVDPTRMTAAITKIAGVLDERAVLDAVGRAVAQAAFVSYLARRRGGVAFPLIAVGGGRGGGVGARCLIRDGLDCRARDGQADYEHPGCHVVYAANRHAVTAEKLPDSIVYDDQAVSSVFYVQCLQNEDV